MAVDITKLDRIYETRELWIRKTVSAFQRRYGGDWDELFAESNWWFVQACRSWTPVKGTLDKHISFRIWTGMLDLRRRKARQLCPSLDDVPKDLLARSYSHLFNLIDELSHDAKTIVYHILKPDLDLELLIADREGMRIVHRALREYLSDWHPERVSEAFFEIENIIRPAYATQRDIGQWLDSTHAFR